MEYALHEVLEVQEMTAFKTLCLTKSKTMKALVSDPKLKKSCSKTLTLPHGSYRNLPLFYLMQSMNEEMND